MPPKKPAPLTRAEISKYLQEIQNNANADCESAKGLQTDLYLRFIRSIADYASSPALRRQARHVLEADAIELRW